MAARGLYQDCASEDTAEAIAQLRPQGPAPIVERAPLIETPSVPIRYIACTQDRAVSPEWGALTAGGTLRRDRRVVRRLAPGRARTTLPRSWSSHTRANRSLLSLGLRIGIQ